MTIGNTDPSTEKQTGKAAMSSVTLESRHMESVTRPKESHAVLGIVCC